MTDQADYVRQGRNGQTPTKQSMTYGFKAPDHDWEIGQRHDFHDFELVQNDYLRNLNMRDVMDKGSGPCKREDYRYTQEEQKIDKMDKLRREEEFVEKGMQRPGAKLQKTTVKPYSNTLYEYGRTKTKNNL